MPWKQRYSAARRGASSLGCAKALVDSERILTELRAEGYELVAGYEEAEVVVVNTCGFITPAVEESLGVIGEALQANGRVVVTGCLGERPETILARHPAVLAVTGQADVDGVLRAVHEVLPPDTDPFTRLRPAGGHAPSRASAGPQVKLTPRHYSYLKIAEGCDHRCSFCIIPQLRGLQRSRDAADVIFEATRLVASGTRELLVIAQDSAAYGTDLHHRVSEVDGRHVPARLPDLARELGRLGVWVRLHYVYPHPHVRDLLPLMAEDLLLPYLDVPLQHASPSVLRAMRRPGGPESHLRTLRAWREACPELTLRSTFIVGFPGETETDFDYLLEWLDEAALDRVGCFKYEPVGGAAANDLAEAVPDEVKEERWHRFMQAQQKISARRLKRKVGTRQQVIMDEVGPTVAKGRSMADAPEIDGAVY
ncbi:MAG: 30S ribosomal protein S12 methylthiotransferase RimO, partial [Deinococcales bacterium]